MLIEIESTPNPNALKFVPLPHFEFLPQGKTMSFNSKEEINSQVVRDILELAGVASVMIGHDFISVTKTDESEWDGDLKVLITSTISDCLLTYEFKPEELEEDSTEGDSDSVVVLIKDLIDTRIREAVARDGGDIEFVKFEKGIVYLRLHGACVGCPSSTITLKHGVENMLKHYVPEVKEVRQEQ